MFPTLRNVVVTENGGVLAQLLGTVEFACMMIAAFHCGSQTIMNARVCFIHEQ